MAETANEGQSKPKSKEEMISYVADRIKEGTNWVERRQMIVNLNYYAGNQWIVWNNQQRSVSAAPNPSNQERITHNILAAKVLAKLAKQIKNRIKYEVAPDSNSQDRIETAKAATKYMSVWWDEQEMDLKTRDVHLNNNVKGWSVLKVVFDNQQGDDITPDNIDANGQRIYTGVITCTLNDPLTMYVDPSATTDLEIRWAVEEKPKDVDWIFAKYGVKVSPEPNINYMSNYDVLQTNSSGLSTMSTNKKTPNMALVRECWIAPCKEYPEGAKITCTQGTFLDFNDKAGNMPYFIFGDIPVPGTVKYRAFLQDMLPIQRTINIAKTMMATHMKRMGNSMWAVPIGSDVDEEMLTNDEGGMFYFNGSNGQPMRVAPNDIPSFFDRIIALMQRDIDDMSGVRELSGNALPAGLDTASGLALMVEQENEKLAVTSQGYERQMKRLLRHVLQLMKKHYTEERQAKILGENNEVEIISFRGSDLSGHEDINIVQGSTLPEMRSAQEDRIMMLWRSNAIVDDNGAPDSKKLLKLMGMGDSKELYEMDRLDENKAKLENKQFEAMQDPKMFQAVNMVNQQREQIKQMQQQQQMMAQNQGIAPDAIQAMNQPLPPPPNFIPYVRDFQNHQLHIYNHNLFRKTTDYDNLPPQAQKMVDAHIAEHEQFIQQAAQNVPPPPEVQAEQEKNNIEKEKNQQAAQLNQAKLQQKDKSDEQRIQLEFMRLQSQNAQAEMNFQQQRRSQLAETMEDKKRPYPVSDAGERGWE